MLGRYIRVAPVLFASNRVVIFLIVLPQAVELIQKYLWNRLYRLPSGIYDVEPFPLHQNSPLLPVYLLRQYPLHLRPYPLRLRPYPLRLRPYPLRLRQL